MPYDVQITPAATRDLKKLPREFAVAVRRKIDGLITNPRPNGVQKLVGEDNLYRIRTGDYRILYTIEDQKLIVVVVKVGNRRDVYRR